MNKTGEKISTNLERRFWEEFSCLAIDDPEEEINELRGMLRNIAIKYFTDMTGNKHIKPPLGLMPKRLHEERVKKKRFLDVCGAINRYDDAGLKINPEWIKEYNDLAGHENGNVFLADISNHTLFNACDLAKATKLTLLEKIVLPFIKRKYIVNIESLAIVYKIYRGKTYIQ